jgi:hypothetical protein
MENLKVYHTRRYSPASLRTLIAEAGCKLRAATSTASGTRRSNEEVRVSNVQVCVPFWFELGGPGYVGLARDKINRPKSYFDVLSPSGHKNPSVY